MIDCTGDADIAHMAGAEYRKTGDKETKQNKQNTKQTDRQKMQQWKYYYICITAKSEMMGMTTVFNASGVDKEDFVKYTEANPATYRVTS